MLHLDEALCDRVLDDICKEVAKLPPAQLARLIHALATEDADKEE